MMESVPRTLRHFIEDRADGRCEYCRIHADDTMMSHEPDHIIAKKHGGSTHEENLAWACYLCNRYKGSDLTSVDPETGEIARLFNPRHDIWSEHFRLRGDEVIPLSALGRVTAFLLRFNRPDLVEARHWLIKAGRYP